MATKFKIGDIVRVTNLSENSSWYDDIDEVKKLTIKLTDVVYFKRIKQYYIAGIVLEKNILPNSEIAIMYCKIQKYDNKLSKM